jgi:hypothetical protein
MKYFDLLFAGLQVSLVHAYLVWYHRDNRKWSLSEHVVLARKSHCIYFVSHVVCEIFFLLFSYQFYMVEHHLPLLHYLNVAFAILDFVQAAVPTRGKTVEVHFAAAYISWCCFLLSGTLALFKLNIAQPYAFIATLLLVPTLGMFAYININRVKIWPFQLLIVPLFVFYLLFVVIGAN